MYSSLWRWLVPVCALALAGCTEKRGLEEPPPAGGGEVAAAGEAAPAAKPEKPDTVAAPGAAAGARFKDNGDGTVLDAATALTWLRCPLGADPASDDCAGEPTRLQWKPAKSACGKVEQGGYKDWRLPTRDELLALVSCDPEVQPVPGPCAAKGDTAAAVDTAVFPMVPVARDKGHGQAAFFTADKTTCGEEMGARGKPCPVGVDFAVGNATAPNEARLPWLVRCVRGEGRAPDVTGLDWAHPNIKALDAAKAKELHPELLYQAAHAGDVPLMKLALDTGADVNMKLMGGDSCALKIAAMKNRVELVRFMLARGADVNLKTGGSTPLAAAKSYFGKDVVPLLEAAGAK